MNALTEMLSTAAAQRTGWALIHFLWQGVAVALALAAVLALWRNRSPKARWGASCAAMTMMAVLPVATWFMVSVEAPVRPAPAPAVFTADRVSPPVGRSLRPAKPQAQLERPAVTAQDQPPVAVSGLEKLRAAMQPILPWAILVWLAGVTVMSAWHLGGWLLVRRMRRLGTRPAGAAVQETFERMLRRLGIHRPTRLLESLRVAVPVVVGWFRPVILLPASAVTGLTPQQLEAILAHEMAHIRRWDCLVQALQAVMETLLFYHPAVWWVSRQIRQESEQCCDDLAVGLCGDRRGYAHALAKVAELAAGPPPRPAASCCPASGACWGWADQARRRSAGASAAHWYWRRSLPSGSSWAPRARSRRDGPRAGTHHEHLWRNR